MTNTQLQDSLRRADSEKRWVAASSLAAAFLLTGTKLGIGLSTNSLGILSEAAHSALDLVAAAVTLWAVKISARPADREHPYGHGKIENLSALFETVLLLVTCVWIIHKAVERFFGEPVHVEANLWAFLVVLLSIAVDFSRSRALKKAADKYASQALEADALHFSTDIWSSLVVLLGLCGVLVGNRFPQIEWLAQADAVAALGVAAIIVWISLKLGKKSVDDLLDSVPRGLHDPALAAAQAVPGVEEVTRLRLRRSGPEIFADLTLVVGRGAAFEQAHDIAHQVEIAVAAVLPNTDVVVHVEPVAPGEEDVTTVVRLLAARHGLGAHGIRIYEEDRQRWLELHLEVSESLLLDEAHRQATQFERALRMALPGVTRIITHIEPTGDAVATIRGQRAGQEQVQEAIRDFLQDYPLPVKPHDVRAQFAGGELSVSFHCTLPAATAITEAHQLTVRLEEYLRAHVPGLGRVAIHVEPDEKKAQ